MLTMAMGKRLMQRHGDLCNSVSTAGRKCSSHMCSEIVIHPLVPQVPLMGINFWGSVIRMLRPLLMKSIKTCLSVRYFEALHTYIRITLRILHREESSEGPY